MMRKENFREEDEVDKFLNQEEKHGPMRMMMKRKRSMKSTLKSTRLEKLVMQ